jgi:hypothetical protein
MWEKIKIAGDNKEVPVGVRVDLAHVSLDQVAYE